MKILQHCYQKKKIQSGPIQIKYFCPTEILCYLALLVFLVQYHKKTCYKPSFFNVLLFPCELILLDRRKTALCWILKQVCPKMCRLPLRTCCLPLRTCWSDAELGGAINPSVERLTLGSRVLTRGIAVSGHLVKPPIGHPRSCRHRKF